MEKVFQVPKGRSCQHTLLLPQEQLSVIIEGEIKTFHHLVGVAETGQKNPCLYRGY